MSTEYDTTRNGSLSVLVSFSIIRPCIKRIYYAQMKTMWNI